MADLSASRRVLVIEDSDDLRNLLTRILVREGYDVVAADDGAVGLSWARDDIDVVILDLGLPGMSGLDVCRQLRADSATADLPIIVLTGRSDRRDVRDGLLVGADAFLIKPVEVDALVDAVSWLSNGRPRAHAGPSAVASRSAY
jgi:two-component system phosphate regulon response regulator PhoB